MFIALEDRVHFGEMAIVHGESVEERPRERASARPYLARARAALLDDASADLIAAAEKLIAAGYRVVADAEPRRHGAANSHFSMREQEVLELLAEGAPNKLIARRLDISVHTAKFHVAAIIAKLGAANRTDATAIAMREGMIQS